MSFATLAIAAPEIWLAVLAMGLLMAGAFSRRHATDVVNVLTLAGLAVAGLLVVFFSGQGGQSAFGGAFVVDNLARIMKALVLFAAALAIIMSVHYMKWEEIERFEYPVLIVLATLGMLAMISANGLIALYMGLELQSLALYVLAAINRRSAAAAEAGLKYFVLGALSSGLLLYGASLVYGFAGTTAYAGIAEALKGGVPIGLIVGLVFVLAGLAFKISAVPFHMWTPDVYQGAPTPVVAFFAAAPKLAAFAVIIRLLFEAFPGAVEHWRQVIVFMSFASMVLGAFAGIAQDNIKRLLAYSSIGHMGFVLMALAAGGPQGLRGAVLYLVIYAVMTIGAFSAVIAMRRDGRAVEEIDDFAGLARTNPGLAFATGALMFSLAGIPVLAGFFAKYFVLLAVVKAGLWPLFIAGVLSSVVAAVYYLRVVKVMYFDEPKEPLAAAPLELKLLLALSVVFVLGFVFWPAPVEWLAQAAIRPFL
ncbi:MAG TPA: NADH-quinone oxidoreductase subunit NuoN [Thermopetrobacter sp.]|nr:NADH-quinone oxidoreductase subunit NuoN [Thermopetrobacter sp.]